MDLKGEKILLIGLDVGGTHIDGVIIKDGKVIKTAKNPNQQDNLFNSIWITLEELMDGVATDAIQRINLSTTISTNAIVENKINQVGMFIQTGPGLPREFLGCGAENIFLSGYMDHRGKEVKKINKKEIKAGSKKFKEKGLEACAIITKFSTRNPEHELEIRKIVEQDFPVITMGHQLSGKLNFPRRVFTAYLNSAVSHLFSTFARDLKEALAKKNIQAPLFILKADGGTMNLAGAEKQPVETILSGPAASLMGLTALAKTNQDAVLLDIGGTTTDIFFLADGLPLFEPLGIKIGKYKTLIRSVYSHSIGLGGDSAVKIVQGELHIGPERAGQPLGLGGPKPTPTDAMIVLEQTEIGNREQALIGMEELGREIGLSGTEMAEKILEKMGAEIKSKIEELLKEINSKPVYTIKELLHGKKIIPKEISLIGGPAQSLAGILEKELNIPCHYPEHFSVANAIGAALAKITTEINLQADTELKRLVVPELELSKKINRNYTLDQGRAEILALLEERALALGAEKEKLAGEIVEAESFNMVKGFLGGGRNIRIKAQIKPGLIQELKGSEQND